MQRKFSRSLDEIKSIVSFCDAFFQDHPVDSSVRYIVDLCIEELFVNMVTYDTETDAEISLQIEPHGKGVQVSLTDYDVDRFDPREHGPADVNAPLEQRTPGGLGLFLVLKMVDAINYEYRDRTSSITFIAGGE
ncbi:MAG: ATP-binding protein [Gammaproteobacteria bacterium]|nr:ATP-binding protein [Gammaproteobacteria bacterium]NNF61748.1 ATP-binding protein [Gammaproteobacteria bacterium]NNM21776.1 ATP-binding protein [Gammaproteobacteria bacterium]